MHAHANLYRLVIGAGTAGLLLAACGTAVGRPAASTATDALSSTASRDVQASPGPLHASNPNEHLAHRGSAVRTQPGAGNENPNEHLGHRDRDR